VLRRALGADDLERMPPHITLVPPVNVRDDDLDDALDRLRDAAGRTRPFRLVLGPPGTFLPTNPVLFLQVAGDVPAVDGLRDRVFRPPLERPLTWPFHPHVTVLDNGDPARIRAGVEALAGWQAAAVLDRVHLMQEERREEDGERWWRPIAEATFGAPAVVGRGGLELEQEVTGALSIDAIGFRDRAFEAHQHQRFGGPWRPDALAVTARRGGRIVGTADGDVRPTGEAHLSKLIVGADLRGEGIGAHLVAAFASAAAARGASFVSLRTEADGPARSFFERLGFERWYDLPQWRAGADFVQLRRSL
jgi:2'-5' RNA ligase/ribosomal protein S18 acetylase RimI-like enzyme